MPECRLNLRDPECKACSVVGAERSVGPFVRDHGLVPIMGKDSKFDDIYIFLSE